MDENNDKPKTPEAIVREFGTYDPRLDLSSYQYPTPDLLPESWRPLMGFVRSAQTNGVLPLLLSTGDKPIFRELYHHPNMLLAGTIASVKTA